MVAGLDKTSMSPSDHRPDEQTDVQPALPARFVPHDPSNARAALDASLRAGHRSGGHRTQGPRPLMRQSIRMLVELSTAAHGLSIQRRLLSDFGGEAPELAVLDAFNRRVQAASGSIVRCCVSGLVSISEPTVQESSWYDLVTGPAQARLADATADPGAAIDLLPGEIADDLAAALGLDEAERTQAAPHLVRGAVGGVVLFVTAGLPYPSADA